MPQNFLKDAEHGPHGEDGRVHIASCYMGPLSSSAFALTDIAHRFRESVGTDFSNHRQFGNEVVQGNSRIAIAALLGTSHENITLTGNTNEGIYTVRNGLRLGEKDTVLIYRSDYLDVKTAFVEREERPNGCKTVFYEGAKDLIGRPTGFDLEEIELALKAQKISLVVVTHVQFTSGRATDLAALAKLCRAHDVPVLIDAAQSFGALDIKPDELGISALVAPLWKWVGGYRGTAFLWTPSEFREKLAVDRLTTAGLKIDGWLADVATSPLREDGRKFEPSTLATESWIPTSAMLGEAARHDVKNIQAEIRDLQLLARDLLSGHPRLGIFESPDTTQLSSFLAVFLKEPYAGKEELVRDQMRELNIDVTARGGFIRLAFHKFTSEASVRRVCSELIRITDAL